MNHLHLLFAAHDQGPEPSLRWVPMSAASEDASETDNDGPEPLDESQDDPSGVGGSTEHGGPPALRNELSFGLASDDDGMQAPVITTTTR